MDKVNKTRQEICHDYYERNKAKIKQKRADYRLRNLEKIRQQNRNYSNQYYELNKDKKLEKDKEYRKNHPEKASKIWKAYCEKDPIKRAYNNCIDSAKKKSKKNRMIEFALTMEDVHTLVMGNCFHCHRPPRCSIPTYKQMNGIDRYDSTKGYTRTNSVSSCWPCNRAKGNDSIMEWENYKEAIAIEWIEFQIDFAKMPVPHNII